MKKSIKVLFTTFFLSVLFLNSNLALNVNAADTIEGGLEQVGENIVLSSRTPIQIATSIINWSLMFLGILAVSIVLYGGFVWMNSKGSKEEIEKAKKILKSGIIGLIIILSSWGIAYFVISGLSGAINGDGTGNNNGEVCVPSASCFCGGYTVCTNGISSCQGYDCTNATSTPVTCNAGSNFGVCQPSNSLCGLDSKICNVNCLCEDKSQEGDSCGFKQDGTCDLDGSNCASGLFCNANSCTCEGPITITGVSPVGDFCENNHNKSCASDSDCPGSTCNKNTPNGKVGNLLTIYGNSFNKISGNKTLTTDDFETYAIGSVVENNVFSNIRPSSESSISIAKTPIRNSSALLLKQNPGVVDGVNTGLEVAYTFNNLPEFEPGHIYGIQFTYQGSSANRLDIYYNDKKISDIKAGQYSNPRSKFFSLGNNSANNSFEFKLVLVAGPTSYGTSLYIDDFSFVDITANREVTIGGVVAKSAAEVYPHCSDNDPSQVIVVVPEGVKDGEITISRNGETDTTRDDNGPKINDFVVNTLARPGLCSLTPDAAQTNEVLAFYGNNLKNSSIFFGNYDTNIAGKKDLVNDTLGTSTVPSVFVGDNSFFANSRNLKSNFLYFSKLNDIPAAPAISSISPDLGPSGQYVTITGSNFGSSKGSSKVLFGDIEADYNFPVECSYSLWSDKQILVKVPEGITVDKNKIQVVTDYWVIDSSKSNLFFTYQKNNKLEPGICRIYPSRGPVDSKTTLFGEYFGKNNDVVGVYFNSIVATSSVVLTTKVDKLEVVVPKNAVSGVVKLENSNAVGFQVGSCETNSDCADGICCSAATTKKGQCASSLVECVEEASSSIFEWAFTTNFSTSTSPNTNDSCLGISKTLGSCQVDSACPNVPGKCSSGSNTIAADKGACCPAGYSSSNGYCIKSLRDESLPWSDYSSVPESFCKNLSDYNNRARLVYESRDSCKIGWVRIANNLCAKAKKTERNEFMRELGEADNCTPCSFKEELVEGRCVIDLQCKGSETCNSLGRCIVDEPASCECCCEIKNNNQDCCAPLICGGTCGNDNIDDNLGFGKCSGCYAAGNDTATRDAACNCTGHNGQFCAVSSNFPTGACVDCATLNADQCSEHADVCCLNAGKIVEGEPVCQGGVGNLVGKNPGDNNYGYCAYYNCATTGDKKCATSTPSITGAYSDVRDCENKCNNSSGNTGLGLECASSGNTDTSYQCDVSICAGPFSSNPFSCINSSGTKINSTSSSTGGECGVCCCDPSDDSSCKLINSKLSCLPDKGSCSGDNRGLCCGCSSDLDCGGNGCGSDSCCYPKPSITGVIPSNETSNVCRNVAIQVNFDRIMDSISLTTGNIKLLEEHPADYVCPDNTTIAATNLKENIIAKTLNYLKIIVSSVFNKDKAFANNTASYSYCQVPINVEFMNVEKNYKVTTSALIRPKIVLAKNSKYLVFVQGNEKLESPASGVLSIDGVGMKIEGEIINSESQGGELVSDFRILEGQIIKYGEDVEKAKVSGNKEDIIRTNKEFDDVEKSKNEVGLLIASIVLDGNIGDLQERVSNLEQIKEESRNIRYEIYHNGKVDLERRLRDLDNSRSELGESIKIDFEKFVEKIINNEFNENLGEVKINGKNYKAFISSFKTRGDICQIDYTSLNPDQYLFSTAENKIEDDIYGSNKYDSIADRDKVFSANAYSIDNQLLNPVTGYSWTWDFEPVNSMVVATSSIPQVNNKVLVTVLDSVKDGKTLLYSTVKMAGNNEYFGGNGKKSSSQIFKFICANPWPSLKGNGTWSPWNDLLSGNPYQYDFYYCRDAGKPGREDDLPEMNDAKIAGAGGGKICSNNFLVDCKNDVDCGAGAQCIFSVLKEYYFFSKN